MSTIHSIYIYMILCNLIAKIGVVCQKIKTHDFIISDQQRVYSAVQGRPRYLCAKPPLSVCDNRGKVCQFIMLFKTFFKIR